jgi:hypothetical protein
MKEIGEEGGSGGNNKEETWKEKESKTRRRKIKGEDGMRRRCKRMRQRKRIVEA